MVFSAPTDEISGPIRVRLADHLPPVSRHVSCLHDLAVLHGPWFDFWRSPAVLPALPTWVLQHMPTSVIWHDRPIHAFHLFTDGSATGQAAGWGLTLFVEQPGIDFASFSLIGCAGGPSHPLGNGSSSQLPTNNVAEVHALFLALAFCCSIPLHTPVHLHLDSTFTKGVGQGSLTAHQGPAQATAKAARCLAQFLEASGRPLQWHHVRSHLGSIGNEIADRAAAAGAARILDCEPAVAARLLRDPWLAWAWMAFPSPDLPSVSQLLQGPEPFDPLPAPCAQAVLDDVACLSNPCQVRALRIKCATANVCTLKDKRGAILQQAEDRAVALVALQETRTTYDWQASAAWVHFHSSASKGQGGCSSFIVSVYSCARKTAKPLSHAPTCFVFTSRRKG